ncbi:hypothetical protein FHT15_001674 [Xanthomonas campestris]
MANISRRRTGELTRALFHILKAQPEGMLACGAHWVSMPLCKPLA